MSVSAVATRVAKGARWLDENYPTWWQVIDVSRLSVASCTRCVLGQVFARAIPTDEQDQILAQAIRSERGGRITMEHARQEVADGIWNGFISIVNLHQLGFFTMAMGFAAGNLFDAWGREVEATRQFELLTDEWTRVIIERRISANLAEVTQLWADNRAEVAALVAA